MIYAALLRGINVGGNNPVPMKPLKERLERLGFEDVVTYIASGNVVFRAGGGDARAHEQRIDAMLTRHFRVPARTVVRTHGEMARLLKTIEKTWKTDPAWRYNVVFLHHSIDSPDVLGDVDVKEDIERVVYCPGTLLWSARADAIGRTVMQKIGSRPFYRDLTIRNLNTTRKVFEIMQHIASAAD